MPVLKISPILIYIKSQSSGNRHGLRRVCFITAVPAINAVELAGE